VLSGIIEVPECNLEFWQNRTQTDNVAAWLDEKVIYESGWSLPVGVNKEDSHGDAPLPPMPANGTPKKPALNLNLARISPPQRRFCKQSWAGLLSANIPCPVIALPISGSELTKISTPLFEQQLRKLKYMKGHMKGHMKGRLHLQG